MIIDVLSIFPEYLAPLQLSLPGKAAEAGLVSIMAHDLREWTHDRHRTVDDTPYGGGAGMVMKPEPWGEALDAMLASGPLPRLLVMTPSGKPFTQADAQRLASHERLVFACGRYEGIDARVMEWARERMPVEEISIGDYVLNGGEVAAMVCIEAIIRLIPGFMGNPESIVEESHAGDEPLVEYPAYTKPASWRGHEVPEILFSGNHAAVAQWRHEQACARTRLRRPDLWTALPSRPPLLDKEPIPPSIDDWAFVSIVDADEPTIDPLDAERARVRHAARDEFTWVVRRCEEPVGLLSITRDPAATSAANARLEVAGVPARDAENARRVIKRWLTQWPVDVRLLKR